VAWLTRGDEVLASLERTRRRPDPESGVAALLERPKLVAAPLLGTLDVAWCRPVRSGAPGSADRPASLEQLEVCRLVRLGRLRPVVPGFGPPVVIVANGGAFERWGLAVGDRLVVHGD